MTNRYTLQGLDCPNCAAKIEREIAALEDVATATVDLMTQSLTVESACDAAALTAAIEAIVHSHEPDVAVIPSAKAKVTLPQEDDNDVRIRVIRLLAGAAIGAAAPVAQAVWSLPQPLWIALLVVAYILLGYDVVWRAVRNIGRGQVFDENFLMSVSSIGAFVIGEYPEAVAVMLFYQVGELCQDLAVRRSRRRIASLMDIRPDEAVVRRDGRWMTVDPSAVAVGECIRVRAGEKLPLDGIVEEGTASLDTKALTGESLPRDVSVGDEVLSGCINQSGVLTVRVTKPFAESTVSKILAMVESASSRKARTEQFITTFARYYTPIVVLLAVLIGVLPPLFLGGWTSWIRRGFVFLVISCPCALVISVPLSFFGGIGAASARGILVKGGNYLEALARVDTVVFDKTGTLTKGTFAVSGVYPSDGVTEQELLRTAAAAERLSTHPIARCIAAASDEEWSFSSYEEIAGKGVKATCDGHEILVGNVALLTAHGVPVIPPAAVGTRVYVARDRVYSGCVVVADVIKNDSAAAVAALKAAGVRTVMLTGDGEETAAAVGAAVGIDTVHASLLPDQKVERVQALQQETRGAVAFVGDGINDAPVLALADVGIAMGGVGADAAVEAADVVLMTDEPSKLVTAIAVAKRTGAIARQNIVFTLAVKVVFLALGALGLVGMWGAVFADVGVALLAVANAMRVLKG